MLDADDELVGPPPTRVIGLRARLALAGFDLGRPGVRAIAALAAVVVLAAAVLAWRAQPRPQPVPTAPLAAAVAATPAASIVVAVSGLVHRPGLVRLPAGSRVADAIEAAGGALPGTDLALVNLARRLSDGELVVIGIAVAGGPSGAVGGAASGPVNLNTATAEQLQALPGVGPVLAQRILDFRAAHGGFGSVGELRQVSGIGDAKYAELKDLVTV
ncbi:MAG: helix-hairpin-helix domain-containing protein [Micromonosporaceae bacterium]